MSAFAKGQVIVGMDYKYPEGALNVDDVKPDGTVVAFPIGGGFQMSFRPEALEKNRFRVVAQAEIEAVSYKAGKFVIDCWEGKTFEGWASGVPWNGWAQAYFPLKAAKRIMGLCNKGVGGKASYKAGTDTFTFVSEHEDEPMTCKGTKLPGVPETVYPIGTGSWTWSRVPDEA